MKTAGIICEYNPIHHGHVYHIEKTRGMLGDDSAIVCVMSGNFVQRGDMAVFNKHARADMAIRCGADLVVELPSPYALSSAERFAGAGVYLLDSLGVCDAISFGSESGDIGALAEAAAAIVTAEAGELIKEGLARGLPYATARQKAADALLGARSEVFKSPNNLLGIEYLKAIAALGSPLQAITIKRVGGEHDGDAGLSSTAIRKMLLDGGGQAAELIPQAAELITQAAELIPQAAELIPQAAELIPQAAEQEEQAQKKVEFAVKLLQQAAELIPQAAAATCREEISAGRGPVFMKNAELAMLSRLRAITDFSSLPDATEGLDRRFARYAKSEPAVDLILERIKTKRYAMSRLRRMLMCACLGITAGDTGGPPPYIRVLAMNTVGRKLLNAAGKTAKLPIITKPASVRKLSGRAEDLFNKEAAASDFYALAYPKEAMRAGGREWRQTPVIYSCTKTSTTL